MASTFDVPSTSHQHSLSSFDDNEPSTSHNLSIESDAEILQMKTKLKRKPRTINYLKRKILRKNKKIENVQSLIS